MQFSMETQATEVIEQPSDRAAGLAACRYLDVNAGTGKNEICAFRSAPGNVDGVIGGIINLDVVVVRSLSYPVPGNRHP